MSDQATWPIATENIYFGDVLAYTPGHRVPPDNVEAHGWQDKVTKPDTSEADEVAAIAAGDYESLKVDQLRDLATERGLDASGNKRELIDALRGAPVV